MIAQATELSALEGREAVFLDGTSAPTFADITFTRQEFADQIEFLRQKRGKPTRAWTDAMQGDHDRAFVVAGVTDMAMLEEFHEAVIEGARTYDIQGFAAEFDRLVEKYGWEYNGGRNWRIRTIFETNINTSYMAGRLRQMRDPEVVRVRPYWQYRHAAKWVPDDPRPEHVGFDGLVLDWNDPWWDVYFPPNGWRCSCGVRSLSRGDLRRMGKSGPDTAPEIIRHPYTHKATGETVQLPKGVDYGWDYMPGDKWERGLVPSALIDEAGALADAGRHAAVIDTPSPVEDLLAAARPFRATPLAQGLPGDDYVRAFLEPFGADIGRAVLWEDPTGTKVPISDAFFRDRSGMWKFDKRGRGIYTPLMAETMLDPDEIWIGVSAKRDPIRPDLQEFLIDRRYIRANQDLGFVGVMQVGRKWWEETTFYVPNRDGKFSLPTLNGRRGGKLIWKRK